MVCLDIGGIWNFTRIAVGAVTVRAAFYVFCPTCRSAQRWDEAEIDKIRRVAKESMARLIGDIEHENQIVKFCTFEMSTEYINRIRPLIEVGHEGWSAGITES
ncbi:hypothetical protein EG329_003781 [Mollisiaceae sp. DMI_Dod_QoI]|nr:hypothetical protein EG329_003781 [Helotiales sp. DMI_Dod_QoI]